MRRWFVAILLMFSALVSYGRGDLRPLPPEKAFQFAAHVNAANELILEWNIAPGYYLYRDKMHFSTAPSSLIKPENISLPNGQTKQDKVRGQYQAYIGTLKMTIPLKNVPGGLFEFNIGYQGCSSAGFCYSPIQKNLRVNLSGPQNLTPYVKSSNEISLTRSSINDQGFATSLLNGHGLFVILLGFLGLGLLLAFTPCVLPMVPILSSIIVGEKKKNSGKKAFFLSLTYVTGMALTYAVLGVVVALLGSSIQADLQQPWVIVLMSGIFVLLALSLFGFYELRLPARWQQQLTAMSNRQKGGAYFGVFIMGSLSTLIVSPCVSAPLVGVLAYIGQTGDVLLGALALLALGIGMGIPLLLIGISADKILPKAGPWMKTMERLFGFFMLGLAIWMLSRMTSGSVTLFLWGMLAVGVAIFLGVFVQARNGLQRMVRGCSFLVLFYGLILTTGAFFGSSNPFSPLENVGRTVHKEYPVPEFAILSDMQHLNQQLLSAKHHKKMAILDYYADWCASCKWMDSTIFENDSVKMALQPFLLLRADVTKNNAFDQAVMKRFHVVGPPTIIFFDANGKEIIVQRIVGEIGRKDFLQKLKIIKEGLREI